MNDSSLLFLLLREFRVHAIARPQEKSNALPVCTGAINGSSRTQLASPRTATLKTGRSRKEMVLETHDKGSTALPHQPLTLLRLRDVTKIVGLSRSEIYRQVKAGAFPPPVKVAARATRWSAHA